MMPARLVIALCISLLGLTPTVAASGAGLSAINQPFIDPQFSQWVARFERPGREVYDQRERIVSASRVMPGMTVADIGAGTGLFTRLFAERVGPEGKVYAVDISPVFVDNVVRISRERNQFNVEGVVNSVTDVMLAPQSIDIAFLCDTYHHFEHPQAMLASIHRALKPGGSLVVVDFRKVPGVSSAWVMGHVRAGQERVSQEITAAGFEPAAAGDFLDTNYFLRFTVVPEAEQGD